MSHSEFPTLNERQRDILQAILEEYIATAEPVGSRTLTKRSPSIDLSPATVRNAMADLEELGLLSAPHPSAGRVPTQLAFRIYVERLAQRGRISHKDRELIQAIIEPGPDGRARDISQVLRDAGRVLSTVSKHASLVILPALDEVVFSHIEFMPLREKSVLVVFVAKSGFIQTRSIEIDFNVDRDELTRMSNYLNSLLGGKTLLEIRADIAKSLLDERVQADRVMQHALKLGQRALQPVANSNPDVLVEGERALLEQPEFSDLTRMRQILRAFEEKTLLLSLLEAASIRSLDPQAAESANTQVVLGSPSGVKELRDLTVITATYSADEHPAGRVGIVGPTRMDYSRVIPLVELTADTLTRSLSRDPEPSPKEERTPKKEPDPSER